MANTLLRPVVNQINRKPIDLSNSEVTATMYVIARKEEQKLAMEVLSKFLEDIDYPVDDLDVHPFGAGDVEIEAKMIATSIDNHLLDHVVQEMVKLEYVRQAFWTPSTTD